MLKIGVFADGKWGLNFLKKIYNKKKKFKILFICGRFKTDKKIKKYSLKKKIPFLIFKNINSDKSYYKIKSFKPDLLVSMSYDQIFKNRIINICKNQPINCHAGKLPKYRGRNVINWAIINGEKDLGITVHFIDNNIDTGNIISQKIFKIHKNDNYRTILKKCQIECPKLLIQSLNKFLRNKKIKSHNQRKYGKGFYCRKRVIGDERINWNNNINNIHNLIRGITSPGPSAQSIINKKKIFIIKSKIYRKQKIKTSNYGKIINFNKKYFDVITKNGIIRIIEWKTKLKLSNNLILK